MYAKKHLKNFYPSFCLFFTTGYTQKDQINKKIKINNTYTYLHKIKSI